LGPGDVIARAIETAEETVRSLPSANEVNRRSRFARGTTESDFEGPLPSSIKPDGFHCYWRGGCDREALCEGEGECIGVDPPLANALNRNRIDEFAEIVRALTYGELIEFACGLWSLRGKREVNGETLPKILHAWATKMELASDCAVHNEPALPAGECDCEAGKNSSRSILLQRTGQSSLSCWDDGGSRSGNSITLTNGPYHSGQQMICD
jgi:hypothetical protein